MPDTYTLTTPELTSLVGRASQVAPLRKLLSKALVGQGSISAIAGDAGVGKSRLLAEIQVAARERGMLVLAGSADPGSSQAPYGLLVDVIGECLPHLAPGRRARFRETVTNLSPHLGNALFPGSKDEAGSETELDPVVRHTLFLAALVEMLLRRAQQHPLLIAFEDLQWADSASLGALQYLATRISGSRLMLVVTYRAGEGERQRELNEVTGQLRTLPHFSELTLEALSRFETGELVGACFPGSDFSSDLLEQLHRRSRGSPSFVIQFLELMRDQGLIYKLDDLWTNHPAPELKGLDSLPEVARARLTHLSVDERDVFTFAAPQGVIFDPQLVARALEKPYLKVLKTLARLEKSNHVARVSRGQYRFSSVISVNAFLAELSPERKRRAHLRLAICLEQMHASEVEQLAHHFYHAGARERALPHLIDSGRRARGCEAFWEAHTFLEQAMEVLDASGSESRQQRLEVTLSLAEIDQLLGNLNRADTLCRNILDAASPDTDLSIIGQAMSLRGSLRFGEGSWETAVASYDRALRIFADSGEDRLLAKTHLRLGNIAFERSRMEDAAAHFDQARETAVACGDVRLLGGIFSNLGVLCSVRGDHEKAVANYAEALQAHRRSNNSYGVAQTMHNLGMTYAGREDWEEALSCYAEGERLARDMGTVEVLANILVSRSAAQVGVGDLGGAETSSNGARMYYEEMQDPLGVAECDKILGIVRHHRGEHVPAAVALLKSRRAFRDFENQLGVAECELELGRARRASGDIGEAAQFYRAAAIHFEEAGADAEVEKARALLAELELPPSDSAS